MPGGTRSTAPASLTSIKGQADGGRGIRSAAEAGAASVTVRPAATAASKAARSYGTYAAGTRAAYRDSAAPTSRFGSPPTADRRRAFERWGVQLGLNALWTRLFYGHRRPDLALADSAALFAAVAAYARTAGRVDRAAGRLVFPYLGWVGFATVLNADILRRNPHAAGAARRDSGTEPPSDA